MALEDIELLRKFIPSLPDGVSTLRLSLDSLDLNKSVGRTPLEEDIDIEFYKRHFGDIINRISRFQEDVGVVAYPFSQSDFFTPYTLFPKANLYIMTDQKPAISLDAFRSGNPNTIIQGSKSATFDYQIDTADHSNGFIGPPLLGIVRDCIPHSRILKVIYFMSTEDPECAEFSQKDPGNPHGDYLIRRQLPIHMVVQFDGGEGTETQTLLYLSSNIGKSGQHDVDWIREFFASCEYQALILKGMNLYIGRVDNVGGAINALLDPVRRQNGVLVTDTDIGKLSTQLDYGPKAKLIPPGEGANKFGYNKKGAEVIKFSQ